jgi:uncharacterized protein YjiS (DUF1127 family)
MTTATTTYTPTAAAPSAAGSGWFGRFVARMMAAQMNIARRRVNEQLRVMSNDTLSRIGFTPAQIDDLRAGRQVDFPA